MECINCKEKIEMLKEMNLKVEIPINKFLEHKRLNFIRFYRILNKELKKLLKMSEEFKYHWEDEKT